MPKIIIEIEFHLDGFEEISNEEQFEAIEEVLISGAESTNSEINVKSIEIFK